MSKVIRRFISVVGKVKLSDFKDETQRAKIEKYFSEQEKRVNIFLYLLLVWYLLKNLATGSPN